MTRRKIDELPLPEQVEHLRHMIEELTSPGEDAVLAELSGLRLTRMLRRLFAMMLKHSPEWVNRERLMNAMFFDRVIDDWPSDKVLDVQICHLRGGLRKTGWRIENSHGVGYRLIRAQWGVDTKTLRGGRL